MRRWKLPPRLSGLLLLVASAGTTLVHRSLWEVNRQGPAQPAEFGIALATFMLASVGVLLLIYGGRLFPRRAAEQAAEQRHRDITSRLRPRSADRVRVGKAAPEERDPGTLFRGCRD